MYNAILLLLSFWYILPAYVANGFAVLAKLCKSSKPIDGGHNFIDGRPLFGEGKTWHGFLIGLLSGFFVGYVQVLTAPLLLSFIETYLVVPPELYPVILMSPILVLLVSLGALLGDLVGSFIKRRLNIPRGRPAPLLDQLDFLVVSLLFGMLIYPLPLMYAVFLIVVTPIIHLSANVISYLLHLKSVPW